MKLKDNYNFHFENELERGEFYKKSVFSIGLPPRVANAFEKAGIRSIAGILRKNHESILELPWIGIKGLNDTMTKIQQAYEEFKNPLLKIKSDYHYPKALLSAATIHEDSYPQISSSTSYPPMKGLLFTGSGEKDVMATLARYLGFDKDEIREHTRRQEIVQARQTIMYLLREYAGMSFPSIGRLLGGRDHTTVMHGYKKIKELVRRNPEIGRQLADAITLAKSVKERKQYAEEALRRLKEAIQQKASSSEELRQSLLSKRPKKIPNRDMKILELYREGLTLQNIAGTVKLSRERVRQIIETTIERLAINESIASGVEIDVSVRKEEEKRKRQLITKPKPEEKEPKERRWSRYYVACKSCGTTSIPHVRNGLCEQCIGSFRGERREEIIRRQNKCETCGISRTEAVRLYGRDFYITKDKHVYCRGCFQKLTAKKLGSYRNYAWSRFYPHCISCGTTQYSHVAKGLCKNCSDVLSPEERSRIILEHGNKCDKCGIGRESAMKQLSRDLHITSNGGVLCRTCFQKYRHTQRQVMKNNFAKKTGAT